MCKGVVLLDGPESSSVPVTVLEEGSRSGRRLYRTRRVFARRRRARASGDRDSGQEDRDGRLRTCRRSALTSLTLRIRGE